MYAAKCSTHRSTEGLAGAGEVSALANAERSGTRSGFFQASHFSGEVLKRINGCFFRHAPPLDRGGASSSRSGGVPGSPSDGFADYCKVDMLGFWCTCDNFGAGRGWSEKNVGGDRQRQS